MYGNEYDGADFGESCDYEVHEQNERLTAENAKLREQVADLQRIINYIDKKFPRADKTCDEPGITLSEAVRRTLADMDANNAKH